MRIPAISYKIPEKKKFILSMQQERIAGIPTGRMQYSVKYDTVIAYVVFFNRDSNKVVRVDNNSSKIVSNIVPGNYKLFFVTTGFYTLSIDSVYLNANGITIVDTYGKAFVSNDPVIIKLIARAEERSKINDSIRQSVPYEKEKSISFPVADIFVEKNGVNLSGQITDSKTNKAIPYASMHIKQYNVALPAGPDGRYKINNLRAGKYTIEFSAIGYQTYSVVVDISSSGEHIIDSKLSISSPSELNEVIVTGYEVSRKNSLLSSVSITSSTSLFQGLAGKVSGLNIQGVNNEISSNRMALRGITTLEGNNQPLVVIDGIIDRSGSLATLNPDIIESINVLSAEAATAIYGLEGVNGALIITTKSKTLREVFRDYAVWKPNFFTDRKGYAALEIEYPDNITGWQTFVVGMDKRNRVGKASMLTQAYKPLQAQMNLPRFLLEGDTSYFVTKIVNHTPDKYYASTVFSVNHVDFKSTEKEVLPYDAAVNKYMVSAPLADTMKASFKLQTTTGFKDGEERKVPVFKVGVQESIGNFWMLQKDTSVIFSTLPETKSLNIYAQNNTLDVLLDEIDHLQNYPFACMEQTASKIRGLIIKNKIYSYLNKKFTDQKMLDKLLSKVQKAQLFDGGWPWWDGGKSNVYITNYITDALLVFRENPLVETNIRNAFLYLQNKLPFLSKGELLYSLSTLSKGRHEMDYAGWINKINFDSLTIHEQWQWVKIKQEQKLNYQLALEKLVNKKQETMFGSIYWGSETYRWYNNEMATSIIAYDVLKNEGMYKDLLPSITRYFLEKRRGYWANTVESATIVNTILPYILEQQTGFRQPAVLNITGDTSFSVTTFPFRITITSNALKNFTINKTGGGMVYLTMYQNIFNDHPQLVSDKFLITTKFQKNGQVVSAVTAGEKVIMALRVDVLKDAEYVMLQIPIPAGCIYSDKSNYSSLYHKEFYKEKVILYCEELKKGIHEFEIELEPRYTGTYTLNPAKAELMYYPVFFGRNEMKKFSIINR